jgi:hypothetical protein
MEAGESGCAPQTAGLTRLRLARPAATTPPPKQPSERGLPARLHQRELRHGTDHHFNPRPGRRPHRLDTDPDPLYNSVPARRVRATNPDIGA